MAVSGKTVPCSTVLNFFEVSKNQEYFFFQIVLMIIKTNKYTYLSNSIIKLVSNYKKKTISQYYKRLYE